MSSPSALPPAAKSGLPFADRLQNVETSAIRELFKLLGKPGIISFAGGFPDPALFDVEGLKMSADAVLSNNPGPVLQYGATEGWGPLREQISHFMAGKGATVAPDGLIVTTGSQQALDLIGKTMISPGDKVIVEAPTFLATIQCFRLYGAHLIGAPIDAKGVDVDRLEQRIAEHQPKLVYLIPTFGNPSGATLSLERRLRVLEIAARTRTLIVEDDPYGELYFDQPPPASLLALIALWHQQQRTVIAVLHDDAQVRQHFPQTLLLAREMVAWGPTPEVLTEANLARSRAMAQAWDEDAALCERAA